jgi:hypothetical protein
VIAKIAKLKSRRRFVPVWCLACNRWVHVQTTIERYFLRYLCPRCDAPIECGVADEPAEPEAEEGVLS